MVRASRHSEAKKGQAMIWKYIVIAVVVGFVLCYASSVFLECLGVPVVIQLCVACVVGWTHESPVLGYYHGLFFNTRLT